MILQEAVDTLQGLTSKEVADLFRKNGITGIRDGGDRCPMANYLTYVYHKKVDVGFCSAWSGGRREEYAKLPQGACDFCWNFIHNNRYGYLLPE